MICVQNTYGTGHLRMALNLAAGLSHEVTVAYTGPRVPYEVPPNTTLIELPFEGYSSGYLSRTRTGMLASIFDNAAPEFLIVEHFPFGRAGFRSELVSFIAHARARGASVLSSFRGILGRPFRRHADLNLFDAILVHTDPQVTKCKLKGAVHTGFVAPDIMPGPKTQVIAALGSGRETEKILAHLPKIKVFGGYYSESFSPDMYSELACALTVVSTAGYNSSIEAPAAGAGSVLIPINSEQEERARAFSDAGIAQAVFMHELSRDCIARAIERAKPAAGRVDLGGAGFVSRFIKEKGGRVYRAGIREKSQAYFESAAFPGKPVRGQNQAPGLLQEPRPLQRLARQENARQNRLEAEQGLMAVTTYPTNVFVELTRNCNCCCRMCSRSFLPEIYRRYAREHDMDFGLFRKIADELFPFATEVDLRGFGESTIMEGFDAYLDYALKYDPQFVLVTNLQRKSDRLWQKLCKNRFILGISVDGGSAPLYERIRRGASFRVLLHNLSVLRSCLGSDMGRLFFICTVQKDNIGSLAGVVSLAASYGIGEVEFVPVQSPEFSVKSLEKGYVEGCVRRALDKARRSGQRVSFSGSVGLAEIEKDNTEPGECTRPWSHAYITHDGRLGPCNHRFNPPLVLGDIRSQGFSGAWNSGGFGLFRSTFHTDKRFEKCDWCRENRYY